MRQAPSILLASSGVGDSNAIAETVISIATLPDMRLRLAMAALIAGRSGRDLASMPAQRHR